MTDTNNQSAAKTPSHIAYSVRERKGQKGVFTRIGAAWPTKNGSGINLQLEASPINGRLTLLLATVKTE